MDVLVTGGAGFIGSSIVDALMEKGMRVRVLDNLLTGKRKNLPSDGPLLEFVNGDVRSLDTVQKCMKGVEFVLHEAALPSVPRSLKDPITSNEINVCGTLNVLSAAKEAGVRRLIYASSSSVYGDTPELPKHELIPTNPLSPYAVSKLAGEQYCRVFSSLFGLETVSLRYFNVFGPRQDPNSQYSAVIPKFIKTMLSGGRPTIFGDGSQTRDFTYVSNVVDANICATLAKCEPGRAMNIACHSQISLNHLVMEINLILGTSLHPVYLESRTGEIKHSFAEIYRAEEEIGYAPVIPFRIGLRKTIEWYANRLEFK